MKRTILLLTVAVMSIALLGISAGPALADHRHFDHDVFDDHDHEGIFNDHDRDEGLFDGGGPICPDEDTEPELVFGVGFVCVDAHDRDFDFDHHHHHHFDDFDRRDFDDHDFGDHDFDD